MGRVLVVSHYFDPEPLPKAGELARALVERGHEVRVVTGLPTYPAGRLHDGHRVALRRTQVESGVAVTRTFEVPYHGPSPIGRSLNYASTAASLALGWTRGWAPDAVYVWCPPPTTVLPAHVLARAGRGFLRRPLGPDGGHRPRIVLDIQDLWPDFGLLAGVLRESRSVEVLRAIERAAYRAADHLVVPTEGYRQAILAKGIAPDAVEVIPNWILDGDVVAPDAAEVASIRRREGWDGRFVVMFAGNLGNAQGLETVVDAAARAQDPEVLWAFVGDGTDAARLAERAAELGIADRVRFLGRRDPATMPALAGAADALLVHLRPSPLAEVAVPTKLNGYLAYGRPILCALGGEAAALLRRAGAGIVVAPGDPAALVAGVLQLRATDPAERAAMGDRGRAFARRELVRSTLLDRYEAALGLPAPPRPVGRSTGPATSTAATSTAATAAGTTGRLLVTGATGSIGPSVVAAAHRAGWRVRAMVRSAAAADPSWPREVEVAVGDLRDPASVRDAVAGCDVVIHLAGVAHRTGPGTDEAHRTVTHRGAVTVFEAAEAAGCRRVVLASSIAVYGRDGTFDERSPVRPTGAYAEAKVAAEADLRTRTTQDGAPLGAIVRLATCYGPGAAGNVTAMLDALARRRFALVGAGANRKTLLHIDDAATALLAAATAPQAAGRTYDASDGAPLPLRSIVATMCAALGRPEPLRIPAAPVRIGAALAGPRSPIGAGTIDTLLADIAVPAARIRAELGFEPAVDLATGIAQVVGATGP